MMSLKNTTPVPNIFFDRYMAQLSSSSIRVYLKIVRNTFGWRNENGYPKKRDWISHSQFSKVGLSNRSVTNALDELIEKNLITLTDYSGNPLITPKQRKQAQRIYYSIVDNYENNASRNAKYDKTKAQNLRPTKEISIPKYDANERMPDHIRMQQIIQEESQKQTRRDNWL
jgi:hypothetical protein